MIKKFSKTLLVFLLPLFMLTGQSMRNLEYQVVKLSYVEVDRALAILKTLGYTVVEFRGGKGELAGEYSFSPFISAPLNVKELPERDVLPIIIKSAGYRNGKSLNTGKGEAG